MACGDVVFSSRFAGFGASNFVGSDVDGNLVVDVGVLEVCVA